MARAIALAARLTDAGVGASITEFDGDLLVTPIASGPLPMALDQAQYVAGTGPCVMAARTGQAQHVVEMATAHHFAEFTAAAIGRGVNSSLSLPLAGAARPSAINLYADAIGAFDDDRVQASAALLARCIAELLPDSSRAADEPTADRAAVLAAQRQGERVRAVRSQLAASRQLTESAAFLELTQLSRSRQQSFADIADEALRDEATQ